MNWLQQFVFNIEETRIAF